MESFRRKDNFLDFSAALFQQIENITNELCNKNLELKSIVEKMWGYPAYIKTSSNDIRERLEKYDKGTEAQIVAYMIFSTMRDDHGKSLAVEKSNKP